ncbi:hypothetical protein [Paenibacillus prosopidis]|uniref:Uncharacterized protein n=1 Tax=Paenibacillus prosopidis TaxID=630520 RepID=A0A368VSV2_9BACL|nr:hypothetical protein [Paenibacillus prosopidis]RCW44254.1 hypothetical protein DFP97_112118 [Paenibacillus prosopidis]
MTFVEYHGEQYMQVMEHSAIRPHGRDRVKVLTFEEDGTVLCKLRTVKPMFYDTVTSVFVRAIVQGG